MRCVTCNHRHYSLAYGTLLIEIAIVAVVAIAF
jgi:hypothetical protein